MFLYTALRKIAGLRDSVCKFSLAYMNKVLSPKVKGGGLISLLILVSMFDFHRNMWNTQKDISDMNLGCRYRSSIAYAILITFLLNGLFFFRKIKIWGDFFMRR